MYSFIQLLLFNSPQTMIVPKDLPVIRTQTDHLQRARLGVLVLVVYLKPEAENTRNLTNKTT